MKKMTNTIIFIAAIVIAIAQYYDKVTAQKAKEKAEKEAEKFKDSLLNAQQEIIKLSKDNIELNKENRKLSLETIKNITGYDSFPLIVIDGFLTKAFKNPKISEETIEFYIINFHLINTGNYPLNNITIKFADSYGKYIGSSVTVTKNGIAQEPDKRFDNFDQNREIKIESLPKAHTERELYTTTLPKELNARFTLEVTWPGGNISYDVEVNPFEAKKEKRVIVEYGQIYSQTIEIDKEFISETIKKEFPNLEFTMN